MSYTPRAFPVQVVKGSRYQAGVKAGNVACTQDYEPRFSDGGFRQVRGDDGVPHEAVDILAPLRAKVVAPRAGRVLDVWRYDGQDRPGANQDAVIGDAGWYVRLEADEGGSDYFSHLIEPALVRSGERVSAGQVIGYVGQTGNARYTCPHLHYGVRDAGGRAIDPAPQLRALFNARGWERQETPGAAIKEWTQSRSGKRAMVGILVGTAAVAIGLVAVARVA